MPKLLPDELLYSYIGRVSNLNILGSARRCLQQLFGSCNVIPSPDLPTRLQELQQRLGSSSPFSSAIEMVEFGTLYPYHRAFLTPERAETATNLLLHGNGKGLKTLIGRLANRFGANPNLRFVPNVCSRISKPMERLIGIDLISYQALRSARNTRPF